MFWQKCRAHQNNRINRLNMTFHLYCLLTETDFWVTEVCWAHQSTAIAGARDKGCICHRDPAVMCTVKTVCAIWQRDVKANSTFKHVLFTLIQYTSTFCILSLLTVMRYESSQTAYIISGRAGRLYICRTQHIWDFNILHLIEHICCDCKYLNVISVSVRFYLLVFCPVTSLRLFHRGECSPAFVCCQIES